MNQLADQFQNGGIDFLSLTAEPPDTVKEFLKEHPIHGIVAIDPDGVNSEAFGPLAGLPSTVLIDSFGNLVAIAHPSMLTPGVIEALLTHRPLPLAVADERTMRRLPLLTGSAVFDEDAAARVVVRRGARAAGGNPVWEEDRYESPGSRLISLLSYAYDVPEFRIEMPPYLSNEVYSLQAWVPPRHPETLKPLMQAGLAAAAYIKVRREERLTEVLDLVGIPGKLHISSSSLSQGGFRPGEIAGDCTAQELRGYLEMATGKTVVLDNTSSQRYLFKLQWEPARSDGFESAVAEQLGLQLNPVKRTVSFLVVESLDASPARDK